MVNLSLVERVCVFLRDDHSAGTYKLLSANSNCCELVVNDMRMII